MKNILVAYMKCSTCQKAKKHLEKLGIDFTIRDIVNDKLTEKELKDIIPNEDIKKFFNTSGLVYKELNLKDKLDKLSFDEKIFLLASNGKLVKDQY